MNTKQIDYCIALAESLNFSKAADQLFVSQPSFSYQIKQLEDEVGFRLFDRNGKGAVLTPAGEQFVIYLRRMRQELNRAIEQGQNFSHQYQERLTLGLPHYQTLYYLPQTMAQMKEHCPQLQIQLSFQPNDTLTQFLKGEIDLVFALREEVQHLHRIELFPLFQSQVYLITQPDDPLAQRPLIREEDLINRTLMIGGGSPPALRQLQDHLISDPRIHYFNSADHDTTLTHVSAGNGVCLAPGFLNDRNPRFSWTPFDCQTTFDCVLCRHQDASSEMSDLFIELLTSAYGQDTSLPL